MRTVCLMLVLLAGLIVLADGARGQAQDWNPWSDVHITFVLPDNGGSVIIGIKHDGTRWKALEVEAFGRKQALSIKQLDGLGGFPPERLLFTGGSGVVVISLRKEAFLADSPRYAKAPTPVRVTTSISITMSSKGDPQVSAPSETEVPLSGLTH
jgi:hypothetical protein